MSGAPGDKTIFLFTNGILTLPGQADNWNGRATSWSILRGFHAEKVEYFVGVISRMFGQQKRARKLARTIQIYLNEGWRVHLIGHSNGCDVILKALALLGWPTVGELHLISAATSPDFDRNGLNQALRTNKVSRVFVYVGTQDLPLWLVDKIALARLIGFGALGKVGPKKLDRKIDPERVQIVRRAWGHSGWFDEPSGEFDKLMQAITMAR